MNSVVEEKVRTFMLVLNPIDAFPPAIQEIFERVCMGVPKGLEFREDVTVLYCGQSQPLGTEKSLGAISLLRDKVANTFGTALGRLEEGVGYPPFDRGDRKKPIYLTVFSATGEETVGVDERPRQGECLVSLENEQGNKKAVWSLEAVLGWCASLNGIINHEFFKIPDWGHGGDTVFNLKGTFIKAATEVILEGKHSLPSFELVTPRDGKTTYEWINPISPR